VRCPEQCPICGDQCVLDDDHEAKVNFAGFYIDHECPNKEKHG
jgi:hypothetical protein